MAGKIIGALVIGEEFREGARGTRHLIGYRVQELHSTKGWQRPFLIGNRHFPFGVVVGEFHRRPNPKKRYTADSGRLMRNRPVTGPIPGRYPVHAWQRKEAARAAAAALAAE